MVFSPEQFLLLSEPFPEPMLLLSSGGLILAGNSAVERRLGVAARALVGRHLPEVVIDSTNDVARYLGACSRSRSLVFGSIELKVGVGDAVVCRAEGSLLQPRAEGREALIMMRLTVRQAAVAQFVSLNQRIDDLSREAHRRLQAELAAKQQAEQLRITLRSIGDGVITTDASGLVVSLNAVAATLTGWDADEAVGLPLENVFRIINEATRRPVENPALRAVAEARIVGLANHTILIAKDGTESHIDDSAAPIQDETGKVQGAILVFRDISARRRSEASVRESETKLHMLADTMPQLAWMAQPDGRVFWCNRRWHQYTGATLEQTQGWGWQSMVDPGQLPAVTEQWTECIASGIAFDRVVALKGADGEFRPFLTRGNPLRDGDGRILNWFGTCTDISEMKQLEHALREADRRKDEFLATLAHELRNPLAPIINSLELLKRPGIDVAMASRTRDMMERQVRHLIRLVEDLLDVSRVMQGKIELRREPVELAAVLASAVDIAQGQINTHNHTLDISVPTEPLVLDADPVRLAQVFGNLLVNSAKYTEPNGHIWLTARRHGSQAVVSVKDNGIGISPDMLPHVFDLFVQADHASAKAQGGLGVGLTLVKKLVTMHEGSVEAHSEGLGMGCDFVSRLTLLSSNEPQPTETQEDDTERVAPARRLLVVDDNEDAATSLAMLLRFMGNEVWIAHSGSDALEIAARLRPDMVFLDIGMPGMDGYETARRLRRQPGCESTVLAALTGWGQQEYRGRASDAGFDHYLVKPLDPDLLQGLLDSLTPSTD
ncbi:MAG: PAS domain S-box protein [Burkholderiaceae bacterium]